MLVCMLWLWYTLSIHVYVLCFSVCSYPYSSCQLGPLCALSLFSSGSNWYLIKHAYVSAVYSVLIVPIICYPSELLQPLGASSGPNHISPPDTAGKIAVYTALAVYSICMDLFFHGLHFHAWTGCFRVFCIIFSQFPIYLFYISQSD